MKKIYIISLSSIATLILAIIISINIYEEYSFNGIEEIHSIKTNYIYNNQDDNRIEILIYSNDPKSFLKEYEDVQATLSDVKEYNIISCNVEEVKRISTHKYKNEKYYGYKLYVKPINVNQSINIEECYLLTRDFEIEVGNITITNASTKTNDIDFTKIYAIGNEYLGYKSITAFVITFKNNTSQTKYIDSVYIGDFNYCDLSEAKKLDDDINYSEDIKNYIPNYKPFDYTINSSRLEIPANKTVKYLIPVYYNERNFLGNTLVYINKLLYIDNFNYITNYDDIDIYESILTHAKFNNS